jgi:hypothetical protein
MARWNSTIVKRYADWSRRKATRTPPPSWLSSLADDDVDLLRALVDSGVGQAGAALAQMAAENGDVATLKWLIDADQEEAAVLLGEIAEASRDEELRQYLSDCGFEPRVDRDS